jgi:hypothetical protein
MKCEDCGIFLKGYTISKYPNVIGFCLYENCTCKLPHHIRCNSNEECKWGVEKNENNTPNSGTADKS